MSSQWCIINQADPEMLHYYHVDSNADLLSKISLQKKSKNKFRK